MRDTEAENEEALCPAVQIKEAIACIASSTGKGTKGKKHINQKTAEDESQRVHRGRYFHFASAQPTSSLGAFIH